MQKKPLTKKQISRSVDLLMSHKEGIYRLVLLMEKNGMLNPSLKSQDIIGFVTDTK